MKRYAAHFLALTTLFSSGAALAEDSGGFSPGNHLYGLCTEDASERRLCMGYIAGISIELGGFDARFCQ